MALRRGLTVRLVTLIATFAVALVVSGAMPAGAAVPGWKAVSLSAASDLLDAQPITVTGQGYTPGTTTIVRQCFGPRSIDCAQIGSSNVVASIRPDGSFEADLLVFRTATLEGEDHDCSTDACTVQVTGQFDGHLDLPISFAATSGDQGLAVTPASGLLDEHQVDVSGEGLPPGSTSILLTQCGPGPAFSDCASPKFAGGRPYLPPNVAIPSIGDTGTFSTDLLLYRTVDASRGMIDCRVEACSVRAYSLDDLDEALATTPVTFAASGTYQWPEATLAVTPAVGVRDGQTVQLSGTGYSRWSYFPPAAGSFAPTEVCRAVADPDPDEDCVDGFDLTEGPSFRAEYVSVDAAGHASGSVPVHRWLDLPSGEWDCAVGGCTIALSQDRNPISNRVPLTFGPEWLPHASADAFVDAVYGRMIGVGLRPGTRASMISALTSRQVTGAAYIADATTYVGYGSTIPETRHDQVVAEVTRTYVAFFGRRPDTGGLAYWVGRMETGMPSSEVARLFGGSSEFRATYGGLSNAQVVDRAYLRILGRAGDAAGRAFWIGRLDAGWTRDRVVHLMARSAEHRAQQDAHVRITVITSGLAGRAPTAAEWASTPLEVARGILAAG